MPEFLPIGSVVLLNDTEKKYMITGTMQMDSRTGEIFDYIAVPYPEGHLGLDTERLFSCKEIREVVFTGYTDIEHEKYMETVSLLYQFRESDLFKKMKELSMRLEEMRENKRKQNL